MKKLSLTLATLFLVQVAAYAQQADTKPSKNVAAVQMALDKWAAAVVSRDMKELAAIYADDLIVTDFNGGTRDKKQELQVLTPTAGMKTVSVVNEDVRIRDHGLAVVVTAITKMKFLVNEKESGVSMRYTAVFVKIDDRWQITTLQTARIAAPPPPKQN